LALVNLTYTQHRTGRVFPPSITTHTQLTREPTQTTNRHIPSPSATSVHPPYSHRSTCTTTPLPCQPIDRSHFSYLHTRNSLRHLLKHRCVPPPTPQKAATTDGRTDILVSARINRLLEKPPHQRTKECIDVRCPLANAASLSLPDYIALVLTVCMVCDREKAVTVTVAPLLSTRHPCQLIVCHPPLPIPSSPPAIISACGRGENAGDVPGLGVVE